MAGAYWLAFFLRFDTGTPAFYERMLFQTIGWVVLIKLVVFVASGMYDRWWRYLSVKDMEGVLRAIVLASAASLTYLYLVQPIGIVRIPRSVAVLDFVLTIFAVAGIRLLARSFYDRPGLRRGHILTPAGKRVIIVGAGEAGRLLIREMQRQQLGMVPVALVDDDVRKHDMRLDGVPVMGSTEEIPELVASLQADEVVIAMPSAGGQVIRRIADLCRERGLSCRILPSLEELVLAESGSLAGKLREVQVEDVLGREPVRVDVEQIAAYLTDRVVLVSGAGGSIGSELCRQIARVRPAKIVLVDHGENNLFTIEQELITERGFADLVPVLADVTSTARMRSVFEEHRPSVVFHAAAYKHVPIMEANPVEAVRNNALGTKTICEIAEKFGAERVVLVSTDKAVEPQTVMGQSKALAEWVVQTFAARSFKTRYMAVRFGNVLGSSGSVVPIFRRQIERGGPVRVTDERMTRFFMTIPEAAQLIIQAGAMGEGGEVFVLDMGKPVNIMDLAERMIELSGKPEVEIEVVGIRPGEKLHEELFAGDEKLDRTSHSKIWRSHSGVVPDPDELLDDLADLERTVETADSDAARHQLRRVMKPRIEAGAKSL